MSFDPNVAIEIAKKEVGYKEKATNSNLYSMTGNAGHNNYSKYANDIDTTYKGWYNGNKNGYDWCTVFFDWCMIKAYGKENAQKMLCYPSLGSNNYGASCTWSVKYYRNAGCFGSTPKIGSQIFFGTSLDNVTHTGRVYKFDASTVYTIEGNAGDGVNYRQYSRSYSKIVGYGYPKYDIPTATVVPKETTPVKSTNTTTTTSAQNTQKEETFDMTMRVLTEGCTGRQVDTLQILLNASIKAGLTVDKSFGPKTAEAVRNYQKQKGLTVDCSVGPKTWASLIG